MNYASDASIELAGGLTVPAWDSALWRPTRLDVSSAWHRHTPFAFWLVDHLRPQVLVELGVHHGVSFAAFCEAVRRSASPARCFAIDSWTGDSHTGPYDDTVFADVQQFLGAHYADFAVALRSTFDDAAVQFQSAEIDLLHIDGQHDYDSALHDFTTWLPKLSSRAVVLFHDTNERAEGFGVWRLWRELRRTYAGFEFLNGSGLGVLAVGSRLPHLVSALCHLSEDAAVQRVRERFAALGERWELESQVLLSRRAAAGTPPNQTEVISNAAKDRAAESKILISAVIPLYNGARYIADALRSVLAQTLPPAEIIVVDDGSTDGGPAIVRDLPSPVPITLLSKSNGGQSSARNFGIGHASGTHIALLDQDDVWYPDHLADLAKPFCDEDAQDLGWSYSNLDEIDDQGSMVARAVLRLLPFHHPKRDLFTCLSFDMFVLPSASLIVRTAFDAIGGFDESLSGYEDDDLFLRLFRAGYDNVFVDQPTVKWRMHADGSSRSYRMAQSRMVYLRKLLAAFPDDRERGRFYRRDMLAPRFLPNVAQEYRRALELRDPSAIRAAAQHLATVARLHRWRVRLPILAVAPILALPRLVLPLAPMMLGMRPLARRVLVGPHSAARLR